MERFEKKGKNLFAEFNIELLKINEKIKREINPHIDIVQTNHSPEIGLSYYYNSSFSSYYCYYSVEVNRWEIINDNVKVGYITSMLDNRGSFYEIDLYYNYNS